MRKKLFGWKARIRKSTRKTEDNFKIEFKEIGLGSMD
jgi:hypothetical protein